MNKLMGFYALKDMHLPVIPWVEYTGNEELNPDLLWTVRSAVYHGSDLNLPRLVGADAKRANVFAKELLQMLRCGGMVLVYPYFIAQKSGTMNVYDNKVIIEAVKKDLWNLVTYSSRDVTIFIDSTDINYDGDKAFITEEELQNLLSYIPEIRREFRNDLQSGKSVMLEWSFAFNCDRHKRKKGREYLVFYEARTLER